MSGGDLTGDEILRACRNMGIDLACGACMSVFYTGAEHGVPHDEDCAWSRRERQAVEDFDRIALLQAELQAKATHRPHRRRQLGFSTGSVTVEALVRNKLAEGWFVAHMVGVGSCGLFVVFERFDEAAP